MARATFRPLRNPSTIRVASFSGSKLAGFGLIQRDRDYDHYHDPAAFQRRPNLYVEPQEGFEAGEVQLVELPTNAEYGDNIVAFFVPDEPARAGGEFGFRYRLHWSGEEPPCGLARMVDLRFGRPRPNKPEGEPERLERKVMMEFSGGALAGLDSEAVRPAIEPGHGRIFRPVVSASPAGEGILRLAFDLFTESREPLRLTVSLREGGRDLSETVAIDLDPAADLPPKQG